jgi:transcriptional regulator of heat shock response
MSILAYENGEIENRIIDDAGKYTNLELQQTSNYLSEKFKNKNINQIKKIIQDDVSSSRSNLEDISS